MPTPPIAIPRTDGSIGSDVAALDAVILAGGLGTRLQAAVPTVPKVLAPVGGRPFLGYLLDQLRSAGIRCVLLCVGHGATEVERYAGSGEAWGVRIGYSEERELRGTGGALKQAEPRIGSDPFIAMNGDSFIDVDLAQLVGFHRDRDARATIAAAHVAEPERYGSLEVDPDGSVRLFIEKGTAGTGLINGGVYVLDRSVLEAIPAGRPVSLEREVFPALTDGRLYAMPADGFFVDIGLPAAYAALDATPERLLAAIEGTR